MYDAPGRADTLAPAVKQAWNDLISALFTSLKQRHPETFLLLDPAGVANGETINAVRWAANPAVPLACLDQNEDLTRALCDFGVRGRHVLHNEYLEYMVVFGRDTAGRQRPKRVIMTTELREYWTTLATHDPALCRTTAEALVGRPIEWSELYGAGITDPFQLSPDARLRRFSIEVAGNGGDATGVPDQPQGKLNRDHLLFMTHPINGLDDLIFIVMFGAKPYVVREQGGSFRAPTKFEIFGRGNALACRNADPAAAMGASEQARLGKKMAFANPLGMYISTDPERLRQLFFFDGNPIPLDWIRLSRGTPGAFQRLEFGPGDDSPVFLDEILVSTGAVDEPVRGGYDVAKKVEVGPLILLERVASVDPVTQIEVDRIAEGEEIPCSQSGECQDVRSLLAIFQQENP